LSAGCQDIVAGFRQTVEYVNHLLGCFTGAVDDLREASSYVSMVIQAGLAGYFKGQVSKFIHRGFDVESAGFYLFEQFF
jgi:hypothetical protein